MEEIKAMIEELLPIAYKQAIEDFLGALAYDVESVTKIGFDGCRDIFEDRKAQKFISDHIMKEITKQLNNKHFRKWSPPVTHNWTERERRLSHAKAKR